MLQNHPYHGVMPGCKAAKHCLSQLFTDPHLSPQGQNKEKKTAATLAICIFPAERRVRHDMAKLCAWLWGYSERRGQHEVVTSCTMLSTVLQGVIQKMSSNRTHSKAMLLNQFITRPNKTSQYRHRRRGCQSIGTHFVKRAEMHFVRKTRLLLCMTTPVWSPPIHIVSRICETVWLLGHWWWLITDKSLDITMKVTHCW